MSDKNKKNCPHIHHDDPAHNNKLREINKGVYPAKLNFAQTTYDQKDDPKTYTSVKNLNLEKSKNYENKESKESKESKENKEKEDLEKQMCDESATDKNKKDFERVPEEDEKFNRKLNKRMNKEQEKRGDELNKEDLKDKNDETRKINIENKENKEDQGVLSKTKEILSEGYEKAKELISKF